MRSWNQVKLEKHYLQLATQHNPEGIKVRRDFLRYRQLLLKLIASLDEAKTWVDDGGSESVALNNLFNEATKIKEELDNL